MDLNDLFNKVKDVAVSGNFDMKAILSNSFIKEHTNFNTIQELLEKLPFGIKSLDDLKRIPEGDLNKFINQNSQFSTWKEMLVMAGTFLAKK
ncbi:hypothetical protein JFL43_04775 [Viridibacillus sp. YIM B01967]|uniref:Uncharacterized protein n=1 Tax=Viridibacillus soli TaxID=2798301 RepID=A0ABS1H4G2_9BACL|nr:hypothetical protein [Viridibacillus soli]MBK3494181.1 hypothetical protein [Viridibacillus soli]